MRQVRAGLAKRSVARAGISEQFPLLRTLLFAAQYWNVEKQTPNL